MKGKLMNKRTLWMETITDASDCAVFTHLGLRPVFFAAALSRASG